MQPRTDPSKLLRWGGCTACDGDATVAGCLRRTIEAFSPSAWSEDCQRKACWLLPLSHEPTPMDTDSFTRRVHPHLCFLHFPSILYANTKFSIIWHLLHEEKDERMKPSRERFQIWWQILNKTKLTPFHTITTHSSKPSNLILHAANPSGGIHRASASSSSTQEVSLRARPLEKENYPELLIIRTPNRIGRSTFASSVWSHNQYLWLGRMQERIATSTSANFCQKN